MLLSAAVTDDSADTRLRTLIASDSPAALRLADAGGTVATPTMAASSRAVCGGAAGQGSVEGDEGCWVPYGRRHGLRRLPPTIPSLGRLARARTSDGRLVISRVAAAHRVCGRKVEDRLVLGLVESDVNATAPALRQLWSHPLVAHHEASAPAAVDGDEEAVPVPEEDIRSPPSSPVGSASPFPAVASSDGTIRAVSFGAMPMAH